MHFFNECMNFNIVQPSRRSCIFMQDTQVVLTAMDKFILEVTELSLKCLIRSNLLSLLL